MYCTHLGCATLDIGLLSLCSRFAKFGEFETFGFDLCSPFVRHVAWTSRNRKQENKRKGVEEAPVSGWRYVTTIKYATM